MHPPPIELLKDGPKPANPAEQDPAHQAEEESEPGRRVLRCAACQAEVADERDVFSMAEEGPVAAYVNPAGFLHEIVTLRAATGLTLVGSATVEHSWFAGYAWTITVCAACHAHLGWQFDALAAQNPARFWGLRRAVLSGS